MSELQQTSTSQRVRLCQRLLRVLLFVWGTLVVGIVTGTIANLNTTPIEQGEPFRTVLSHLVVGYLFLSYPFPIVVSFALLILITLLCWLGSREAASPSLTSPQISAQDRERILLRLRFRYEQMLTQSLQGAVQLELGLASRPAAISNAASLLFDKAG